MILSEAVISAIEAICEDVSGGYDYWTLIDEYKSASASGKRQIAGEIVTQLIGDLKSFTAFALRRKLVQEEGEILSLLGEKLGPIIDLFYKANAKNNTSNRTGFVPYVKVWLKNSLMSDKRSDLMRERHHKQMLRMASGPGEVIMTAMDARREGQSEKPVLTKVMATELRKVITKVITKIISIIIAATKVCSCGNCCVCCIKSGLT